MRELKVIVLRLLVAAFLVAFCLSMSRAEDSDANADVPSYSCARGVFAGMNMNGSSIPEDRSETRTLYASDMPLADIFGGKVKSPMAGDSFLKTVEKHAGGTPKTSR